MPTFQMETRKVDERANRYTVFVEDCNLGQARKQFATLYGRSNILTPVKKLRDSSFRSMEVFTTTVKDLDERAGRTKVFVQAENIADARRQFQELYKDNQPVLPFR